VKLFNTSPKDYKINAGDKIAQLVIVPCLLPELELVDKLEETDRGDGGFGSTGR
jgi:dUTP pyrophosphatase